MFPALIIWGRNDTCWSGSRAFPRAGELHRAVSGLSHAGHSCGAKPACGMGNLGQSLEEQSWGLGRPQQRFSLGFSFRFTFDGVTG